MRLEGFLDRHERGELNQEDAAEMLGIPERTCRRWRDRLRARGGQPVGSPLPRLPERLTGAQRAGLATPPRSS